MIKHKNDGKMFVLPPCIRVFFIFHVSFSCSHYISKLICVVKLKTVENKSEGMCSIRIQVFIDVDDAEACNNNAYLLRVY